MLFRLGQQRVATDRYVPLEVAKARKKRKTHLKCHVAVILDI
jgi:hypothetical protein